MNAVSRPMMPGDAGYPYFERRDGGTTTRPKPDDVKQEECLWLLQHVRECNPDSRFACTRTYESIGVWNNALGRYQMVIGHTLMNTWVELKHELLVNGKLTHQPEDWLE